MSPKLVEMSDLLLFLSVLRLLKRLDINNTSSHVIDKCLICIFYMTMNLHSNKFLSLCRVSMDISNLLSKRKKKPFICHWFYINSHRLAFGRKENRQKLTNKYRDICMSWHVSIWKNILVLNSNIFRMIFEPTFSSWRLDSPS